MDSVAEIDAFCNRVNEVSSLLAELKNETISDQEIHNCPCQKRVITTSQDPPDTSPDARRKVLSLCFAFADVLLGEATVGASTREGETPGEV